MWIYLLISIVLSVLLVPRLTAGATAAAESAAAAAFTSQNDIRIMKPVVSQTCVSQPSIKQMLPVDEDAVPGKQTVVWPSDNLHSFKNTEMLSKLCGPASTAESLKQWKNVEQSWQKMYSEEAIKTRHVKDTDEGAHLRKIKPLTQGWDAVCTGYYHNPSTYCKMNQEHYPCPNYWIENGTKKIPSSEDMLIPGLKK
jgi:hypothetical protein